jgi:chorismate synthase
MSIPAVKAVEIGIGVESPRKLGSEVHDEIDPAPGSARSGGVKRRTNRAGGLEGGITNGEPLVVRAYMKPISTLMRPLSTVDLATGQAAQAVAERSDVTAVPAMGVIAEAMLAFVVADAMIEKFGGDSLGDLKRNFDSYVARLAARPAGGGARE